MGPTSSARGFAALAMSAAALTVAAQQQAAVVQTSMLTMGVTALGDAKGTIAMANFSFAGATQNTTNLPPSTDSGMTTGGSSLLILQGQQASPIVPVCLAQQQCSISSSATSFSVTGLRLLDGQGQLVATETWTVSALNASALAWTIQRTYGPAAASSPLAVDRLGLSLRTTGGLPIYAEQIPSYLSLGMFLNTSSTGGWDLGNGMLEYLSPAGEGGASTTQPVRFSPTGALFFVQGSATYTPAPGQPAQPLPLLFSFAKPFVDGTASVCNLGFEAVDPRGTGGRAVVPGAVQAMTMVLHQVTRDAEDALPQGMVDPFPSLQLSIPNATLGRKLAALATTQYQLNGWIFGNNPASVPCLHEMAWWPLISSLYPAGSPAVQAMQQELSFFATCGWSPSAWPGDQATLHSCNLTAGAQYGMTQRYASTGYYDCPWGPLQDQNVMFPISVYYTVLSSGDRAWLGSMKPALQAMEAYLASMGLALPGETGHGAGVPTVFVSPASGIADGRRHASNWYDVILFGHYDAYLAVHGVWAMDCLAKLYAYLGDGPAAARAAAVHAAAVSDFNTLFWDEASSSYRDWIDVQGNARSYFYVDIAFTAILAGVASPAQTAALFAHYDARLEDIYTEYKVPAGNIWSPPCNLYPVTNASEYANSPGTMTFPMYENGGSFYHTIGLQLAALGVANRSDDAYTALQAVMDSGFGDIRGWAQQLYWGNPDSLVGFDPLNTALLAVWGFLRAGFGVAPTLAGTMTVTNPPAAALEGASWNTSVMGQDVCLKVAAGATVYCNGTVVG